MSDIFIAPNGDGGVDGSGSFGSPFKLWSSALAALSSFDTLVVKDGNYTTAANGNILYTAGALTGIAIVGESHLGAIIASDGTQHTMRINNSAGWLFEWLVLKNAEKLISAGGIQSQTLYLYECSGFIVRKCLFHQNNNAENTHHVQVWSPITGAGGHLVEQCEFYNYNRHGVIFTQSNGNRMRLCYCNGGDEPDVSGGFHSVSYNSTGGAIQTGDFGGASYPASNNLFESNIFENVWMGSSVQATNISQNNTFIGNVDVDCYYGHVSGARGTTRAKMPINSTITHHVSIRPRYYGAYLRGCENAQVFHASIFDEDGQAVAGIAADRDAVDTGDPAYYGTHLSHVSVVALGSAISKGINIATQVSSVAWSVNYANAFNTITPFTPSSSNGQGVISNHTTVDPQFGDIRLWVPNGDNGTNNSPLSGAGAGGKDIGATVLYAFDNGLLTGTPLWDPSTGAWLFALPEVAGINDTDGAKAGDVHERITPIGGRGVFPSSYSGAIPGNDPTISFAENPKDVTPGEPVLVGGNPDDLDEDIVRVDLVGVNVRLKVTPIGGVVVTAS